MGSFNVEAIRTSVFYDHQLNYTFLPAKQRAQELRHLWKKVMTSVHLPVKTSVMMTSFRNVRGD